MDTLIKSHLSSFLQDHHWRRGFDLGCGFGDAGRVLKQGVDFLYGIDLNRLCLFLSQNRNDYDELFRGNILNCVQHVEKTDVIFLMDVLEHLPKHVGLRLLQKIESDLILTTPLLWNLGYSLFLIWSKHRSLWTTSELNRLGFEITVLSSPKKRMFDTIFAFRLGKNNAGSIA